MDGRTRSGLPTDLPRSALPVGSRAPGFVLLSSPQQTVSLGDFRGQPVVVAFYPADWCPICADHLALLQEILSELGRFNAALVAISVDGVFCHLAFASDRRLEFPLLADFEPKGAVARAYGVYRGQDGTSERAIFVIDREGIIRWSYAAPVGISPGADGILTALEAMQAKGPPP